MTFFSDSDSDSAAPLRIVHIISGLGHGGAETVLHRLVTAPAQQDDHVVISMGDAGVFGPRLRDAGVDVHVLGMRGPVGILKGLWRLYGLLRRLHPDVVQTWMYHADFFGGVIARLAGIRAVSWGIRNSGADLAKSSKSSRVLAALCAPLSHFVPRAVVACAENAACRHVRWGYAADRMLVVSNGYELSQWRPDAAVRSQVRAMWEADDDTVVIGCVARWNPLKDHANLIAALAQLMPGEARVRAVLIGQDMTKDNEALMAILRQYGLADRIMLLGRRDDVPRLMQGLDLHVLSSRAEGFPNVVAEAMAAGVLCVVTDVGDAAHIVGQAGWVVPPRDAGALAQGMAAALAVHGTPAGAERIRQGRDRVKNLFSLDTMVGHWRDVWRNVATSRGPVHARSMLSGWLAGPRRLLFVVNNPAFFLSHRLPVAQAARDAGFKVHVATMDGSAVVQVRAQGFIHHVLPLTRSGRNPWQEICAIHALWQVFRQVRPDIVHAVTIKPVLYGGIAARLAGVPAYVAAVSGLGYIFTRVKRGWDPLRWAVTILYRLALGHRNSRVVFQNSSDQALLQQARVVRPGQAVLIRGSGVDLNEFAMTPEPPGPVTIICVARLLRDKGIYEFIEAARLSQQQGLAMRWLLAGSPDPGNPASITKQEVQGWHDDGVIEWLGERQDIARLYQQSHIAVLPSYREGLPKSLVEAAACGRAIVTSDVPGCRDVIQPGVSGLLVPPRDAHALQAAVRELAMDAAGRRAMGQAGRALAEHDFDIHHIVRQHLALYDVLTLKSVSG